MADMPSRALVLYGDGLANFVDSSHVHLHSLASKASCGFLSLPNAPPSETEDERIVREFALLMDSWDAAYKGTNNASTPSISDRFMEMKAAIVTKNPSLKSFGVKLGFTILPSDEVSSDSMGLELMKLLGFQQGNVVDTNQFDLVFVHMGAGEREGGDKDDFGAKTVAFIDSLVAAIMNAAQPGSAIGSRLHLSLVMSYGSVSEINSAETSVLISNNDPKLLGLFPRQSYTMRGEQPRPDVRHNGPMLVAQLQYAVTRMDKAQVFAFKDFKEHGGNLVIPADRFLHEVAFKLWKAPKYGA
ncbi:unnamed protein product [Linum trigynum]|uniref:Uncharacterized protein n=1 Tax=Linum trigynum TaxID=586398 RepID=A0AAV2F007_9ROSI